MRSFDELIEEARKASFEGWDFSFLDGRIELEAPPWDYAGRVGALASGSASLLDLGTGGGEFLAEVSPRPPLTVATEGWMPNVPLAAGRLLPLGIAVVAVEGARDNVDQTASSKEGRLPFLDASFAAVIDRHEAFLAAEVARVLAPGGTFLTQQVGTDNEVELNAAINGAPTPRSPTLEAYVAQLERAGFEVVDAQEARPAKRYLDVGAVLYNLLAIPWQVPGFDPNDHRGRLEAIHETITAAGAFQVHHHRLMLEARKS